MSLLGNNMSKIKSKIALIGAFNLADGYLGAAKALERLGYEIAFIPAMLYKHENPKSHVQLIIDHINNEKPDICLWWRAETLSGLEFHKIRKSVSGKFILYSWDDPLQWEHHIEMPYKCRFLDAAFSCCMDSVEMYKQHGVPIVEWCPPGFDPEVHYPEIDDNYKCDISIVCTNLYHGRAITQKQHLSRKDIIDKILEDYPSIDLRIYGSENFREIYPNHYKGWISFNESRKVFHNSRINICTHIRPDGDMYINERVCQILGSGGFLMIDTVKGLDKVLTDIKCLSIDPLKDLSLQNFTIEEMLNDINNGDCGNIYNYSEKAREFAMKNLTWDCWSKRINEKLEI